MASQETAVFSPLLYYDLLNRPLTALEIFKYLPANTGLSFFQLTQFLEKNATQKNLINSRQGLFFLNAREDLLKTRIKKVKISQLKWRQLKKSARCLAAVPFLRLVAVTGSLTDYHAHPQSDFDLLVIVEKNRLWLARIALTVLTALLGIRRHDLLTADRFCLNCYLTTDALEISQTAKPRDFHSAQEYGRLVPIMEIKKSLYQEFTQKNTWLKSFLNFYPWNKITDQRDLKPNRLLSLIRSFFETLLGGRIGDWLEKSLGQWQKKRIRKKEPGQPADQIYVSDSCLMLHPQSKSYILVQSFESKINQLN